MSKILITGSAGFIGSNLALHLSKRKHRLYCSDLIRKTKIEHDVTYVRQDLKRPLAIDKFPRDIDCIVHLGASMDKTAKNLEVFQINTVSTLNLLEYGKDIGIKEFIFASTGGIYGYNDHPCGEGSQIKPIDFYALSKYESELLIYQYAKYFTTIILRFYFPYGRGQKRGIVPLLIDRIKNGEAIIIYNGKNPRINPIHVKDVTRAIERSLLLEGHHIFNIAGNDVITIENLAKLIGKYMKKEPVFRYVKDPNIIDLIGDNSKMRRELRITPIGIDDGIRSIIET